MGKFKVGDRVAVYQDGERLTATVLAVFSNNIDLSMDIGRIYNLHAKQCRLLKAKPKAPKAKLGGRVIWVQEPTLDNLSHLDDLETIDACLSKKKIIMHDVKFIEAEDQS